MLTFNEFSKKATIDKLRIRVMKLMEENKVQSKDLAREIGTSKSTISRLLVGHAQSIKLQTIWKIADFFDMTIEELVLGNDAKQYIKGFSSQEEQQLLFNFRKMNPEDQKIINYIVSRMVLIQD